MQNLQNSNSLVVYSTYIERYCVECTTYHLRYSTYHLCLLFDEYWQANFCLMVWLFLGVATVGVCHPLEKSSQPRRPVRLSPRLSLSSGRAFPLSLGRYSEGVDPCPNFGNCCDRVLLGSLDSVTVMTRQNKAVVAGCHSVASDERLPNSCWVLY